MLLNHQHSLKLLEKADKPALMRFYRQQHYNAGFKGFDFSYCLFAKQQDAQAKNKTEEEIVSALIFSYFQHDNPQALMHGVVTADNLRNQGLASELIKRACELHLSTSAQAQRAIQHSLSCKTLPSLVCFVTPKLEQFYLRLGFTKADNQSLSPELERRFIAYSKHQKLLVMVKT